jgi:uncharacterized protein (DUF1330 family)
MSAYMILDIEVTDADTYATYAAAAPATVARFGGRYLVRGATAVPIEGGWEPSRIVLLEFPSMQQLQAWLASPEYTAIVGLRHAAARTRAVAIEGYVEER